MNLEWRHFVVDIEELEEMDASEIDDRRLNAKEETTPKIGEHFIFLIADEKVKLSGGDQVLRTSTLLRDSHERGEESEDLRGESDGSPPPPQESGDGEAIHDFWSISGNFIYRHHVEPRVKLYSPREESHSLFHFGTLT